MNRILQKLSPLLWAMVSTLTLSLAPFSLSAQESYPTRPLTLVVGFPPGGPNDILGRQIAKALTQRLNQPVEVINQPGDSGNQASAAVAHAKPDGYTLLLIGPANAINASLFQSLSFNFQRDIVPVGGLTREALVLVVHPSVPVNTVNEFISYAKSGAKITMASTGKSSSPHVAGLMFNRMAGLQLPIVHFNGGGPALKNMIEGNTTQMMFEPISAAIEPIKGGKLRALGLTTTNTSTALPNTPPIATFLPGYEASAVTGIGVPNGTPLEIVVRLNREINAALTDPSTRIQFLNSGGEPLAGSPSEFSELINSEIKKWGDVLKAAGIKTE